MDEDVAAFLQMIGRLRENMVALEEENERLREENNSLCEGLIWCGEDPDEVIRNGPY